MENQQEILEGVMRTERLAFVIGQSPKYIRDDIATLLEGDQLPGSFGELIKHSVEMHSAHKEFEGTNVVSIFGKAGTR
ncbi:hypothetical protein [Sideroxydans sp.]